jgi:site-specific recombinase XerD
MLENDEKLKFEQFLFNFTRKNNKKLGQRTIQGLLTMAKYLAKTKKNKPLSFLQKKHKKYLEQRNHPTARYSLWMYLKYLGYNDKLIREVVSFTRNNTSALNDEEKMAQSVLSKEELFYLVSNITKQRDKLIVKLLYDTGARVSELTNITLKDISFRNYEIKLLGKGRKPRSVFFQKSTNELIKAHIKEKQLEGPNTLLFAIKPITVWYHIKKYGQLLLNKNIRPHMLRHSRLQHMADVGVDSFLLKSYAGHSDISTTQIYVKTSKHQGKIAFNKAGDIWDTKEKKKDMNLTSF